MRVKQNEEETEEIGKSTIKVIMLWDESTGQLLSLRTFKKRRDGVYPGGGVHPGGEAVAGGKGWTKGSPEASSSTNSSPSPQSTILFLLLRA